MNVPALVGFLQQYNHSDNWYLGRPSISHPMEVLDRANPGVIILPLLYSFELLGFKIYFELVLTLVD